MQYSLCTDGEVETYLLKLEWDVSEISSIAKDLEVSVDILDQVVLFHRRHGRYEVRGPLGRFNSSVSRRQPSRRTWST